jgi:hypothetical protein
MEEENTLSVNEEKNLGVHSSETKPTSELNAAPDDLNTPMGRFRNSVGFQIMFVLYSGLEIGKAIDHICNAGERLLAACAEWRPLESAPKDGTQILLINADGIQVVGMYGKHNHVPIYGWIRPVELYGEEVDGFDAILWQPLPAKPATGDDSETTT